MSLSPIATAVSTVQKGFNSVGSNNIKSSSISFADLLSDALTGSVEKASVPAALTAPLLTTPEQSRAARPDLKTFVEKTGAKIEDAIEFLYGTVGSNTDTRDWNVILNSSDPITTVRQATRAMYMDPDREVGKDTITDPKNIIDQSGNFAVYQVKDANADVISNSIALVDGRGRVIRDSGSSIESIKRNAWLFGFDTEPLANLKASAGKISNQIYELLEKINA